MRKFLLAAGLALAGLGAATPPATALPSVASLAEVPLALASLAASGGPGVHALVGARVIVAPGRVIEKGTVVLRDGIIAAVGPELLPPADARIWDVEGLTIYPGLIEPYSARSPAAAEGEEGPRPLPGGHENPLITPERDAVALAADSARNEKLRAAGFTTALVAWDAGLLRGGTTLLNLGDGPLGDHLLGAQPLGAQPLGAQPLGAQPLGGRPQVVAFATDRRSGLYPSALMGSVALLRQSLLDAAWYREAQAAYGRNPAQARPARNLALEALAGVVEGSEGLIFESRDVLDTLRFAAVAEELHLRAWVVGNGQEYQRLPEVAATGLVHLLPLAFPADPPGASGEDDLSIPLEELRHWERAPDNPKLLLGTGLTVAFTTAGLADPMKIHGAVARAIERGLGTDEALAAFTTTPARLLGLADRAGTVEVGKMANLVLVEGDLFVEGPKIREVWIDGRRHALAESRPPEVDPAGTWEVTLVAGGQQIPVSLTVRGAVEDLSATLNVMGNALDALSAEVSGKTLTVVFDAVGLGMAGNIVLSLTIDGDSATGDAESPMGPARLSASRTSRPSPEVMP